MTKDKKGKTDGLVKFLGIVASLATIFGLYVTIFGVPSWLKGNTNQKHVLQKSDLINNPTMVFNSFKIGDTLRLEETLSLKWSGVSNCGEAARITGEYESGFNVWKTATISQIDSLLLVRSDYEKGTPSNSTRKNQFTGVRTCNGSGTIKCWIELVKQ